MAARGLIALAAAAAAAGAAVPLAAGATSPRQWLIYFQFDSTAYAGQAEPERTLREFADFARGIEASRIVVVGHADTAGPEPYNAGLSLRRAETVADDLKRLGVTAGVVSVQARGETEPRVPTGDGVPEALNRRAEIVWLK